MKKKLIVVLCVLLVIILIIPIPMRLKDGGTVEYKAFLYSISDVHRLAHNVDDGYQDGIIVEILGVEVFNSVK